MAYEFSCADAGKSECAFEIRDENQEELTQFVQEHARNTHDMEMSESDVRDATRTV